MKKLILGNIVLKRTFKAPIGLLWKAWTEPARLAKWWGPKGFTNPVCRLDAKPGGSIYIEMKAPDGEIFPMKGVFTELERPSRLSFLGGAADKKGGLIFEIFNSASFTPSGGKTKLCLKTLVTKKRNGADQYLKGQKLGWSLSLDKLAAYLGKP